MIANVKEKPQSASERIRVEILSAHSHWAKGEIEKKIERNEPQGNIKWRNNKQHDWAGAFNFVQSYANRKPQIHIEVLPNNFISIPQSFSTWAKAINDSKYISGYTEVDEETGDSIYYKPETWYRSIYLLRDIIALADTEGYRIPAPLIFDGSCGSIDIRWKSDRLRLLVNIPKDESGPVNFHGDDINKQEIKGKLYDFEDLKNVLITILKSA